MEIMFVGAIFAAMLLVVVYAIYHHFVKLGLVDALRIVQSKKKHAVQWARYYTHEAICSRKQGNHISFANSLMKKTHRMLAARKFSNQAKVLTQKISRHDTTVGGSNAISPKIQPSTDTGS
ncbi:hypothetical protein K5D56_26215 [Pseudomonas cichorii]|nr:hypothetical protein [Pseudomonas cichorii]MBX8557012.1 hypothetical protein [Pseudomonas cichorii]MBX8592873.1 hypothetical protein [Pseudomonas cichorii]